MAVVDEAAWHGEELVGDGGRDGELARGVGAPEAGGPAHEVVREHAAGEPGAVGGESSGGAAAEPGAFFEVSDGELDCGVAAVVCVGGFGVEVVAVGDEAVVTPVGPQLGLGAEQAAAAYDQAQLRGRVGAAELVAAAAGFDGCDHVIGEEPRIGAHRTVASAARCRTLARVSRAKCTLPR